MDAATSDSQFSEFNLDPALAETVETAAADEIVEGILRLDDPNEVPPLFRVVSRFNRICTGRFRAADAWTIRQHPNVFSLKAARPLGVSYEEDLAALDLPLPTEIPPRSTAPFGGRGCIVAALDFGLDFAHPNFLNPDGTTRLIAFWHQGAIYDAAHPNPYGYGRMFSPEEINAALRTSDPYLALNYHPSISDTGNGSHGTHTLDIAAGNGRVGRAGSGSKADLIFVHLSTPRLGVVGDLGDSVRMLEGLDYVDKTASGRPWVVNLSVGRTAGSHDGTSLVEQGMHELMRLGPGRVIVQSAGNYRTANLAVQGWLRDGEYRDLAWIIDPADTTDNEIDAWYSGKDRFVMAIRPPQGTAFVEVKLGDVGEIVYEGAVVGRLYHRRNDPNNRDNHAEVFLYPGAPPGVWTLRLIGEYVISGRFHAWIERDLARPGAQSRFDAKITSQSYTLGTIATSPLVITVGAYDANAVEAPVAPFSSWGPTRDERRNKPELLAPGVGVIAARSIPSGARRQEGLLIARSGTSMAAPHVTGSVAAMFEAAGRPVSIDEIRDCLKQSAHPLDGGEYEDCWGRLNTAEAISRIASSKEPSTHAVELPQTFELPIFDTATEDFFPMDGERQPHTVILRPELATSDTTSEHAAPMQRQAPPPHAPGQPTGPLLPKQPSPQPPQEIARTVTVDLSANMASTRAFQPERNDKSGAIELVAAVRYGSLIPARVTFRWRSEPADAVAFGNQVLQPAQGPTTVRVPVLARRPGRARVFLDVLNAQQQVIETSSTDLSVPQFFVMTDSDPRLRIQARFTDGRQINQPATLDSALLQLGLLNDKQQILSMIQTAVERTAGPRAAYASNGCTRAKNIRFIWRVGDQPDVFPGGLPGDLFTQVDLQGYPPVQARGSTLFGNTEAAPGAQNSAENPAELITVFAGLFELLMRENTTAPVTTREERDLRARLKNLGAYWRKNQNDSCARGFMRTVLSRAVANTICHEMYHSLLTIRADERGAGREPFDPHGHLKAPSILSVNRDFDARTGVRVVNEKEFPTYRSYVVEEIGSGPWQTLPEVYDRRIWEFLPTPPQWPAARQVPHEGVEEDWTDVYEGESLMNSETVDDLLNRVELALWSSNGDRRSSETSFLQQLLRELGVPIFAPDVTPAALFRAAVNDMPVMQSAKGLLKVIALPSKRAEDVLQAGDWMLRVVPGTGDVGHVSVLASDDLLTRSVLVSEGIAAESAQPGFYGLVIEGGAFPHSRNEPFARRVLDSRGRVPPHTMILRPQLPRTDSAAEFPTRVFEDAPAETGGAASVQNLVERKVPLSFFRLKFDEFVTEQKQPLVTIRIHNNRVRVTFAKALADAHGLKAFEKDLGHLEAELPWLPNPDITIKDLNSTRVTADGIIVNETSTRKGKTIALTLDVDFETKGTELELNNFGDVDLQQLRIHIEFALIRAVSKGRGVIGFRPAVRVDVKATMNWGPDGMARNQVRSRIESKLNEALREPKVHEAFSRAFTRWLVGGEWEVRSLDLVGTDLIIRYIEPPRDEFVQVFPEKPQKPLTPGNLSKVDHIVVVMMENRSFDHMLGYLKLTGARSDVDGLTGKEVNTFKGQTFQPIHLTDTLFDHDPCHDRDCVQAQVRNDTMAGFVASFAAKLKSGQTSPGEIMGYYDAKDLPVYDTLAREFVVCDRWFASHPGPTFPNRFYTLTGRLGLNQFGEPVFRNPDLVTYAPSQTKTIFDHLSDQRVTWHYYEHGYCFLRLFHRWVPDSEQIRPAAEFFSAAASGKLPSVSFIDPDFIEFPPANDDHAPADVRDGQRLIGRIVNALMKGPAWPRTLLLIAYDEHGGFFDHVVPPRTINVSGEDRYGVRVPAFVISPLVERGKVSHTAYDHTSILKTIIRRFCSANPPDLGERVAAAADVGPLLSRAKPRRDLPVIKIPAPSATAPKEAVDEEAILTDSTSLRSFEGLLAATRARYAGVSSRAPSAIVTPTTAKSTRAPVVQEVVSPDEFYSVERESLDASDEYAPPSWLRGGERTRSHYGTAKPESVETEESDASEKFTPPPARFNSGERIRTRFAPGEDITEDFTFEPTGKQTDFGPKLKKAWHTKIKGIFDDKIAKATDLIKSGLGISLADAEKHVRFFSPASHSPTTKLTDANVTWRAFPIRFGSPTPAIYKFFDERQDLFDDHGALIGHLRPQDEYCEWQAIRDSAGKIVRVIFTSEPPEYYDFLYDPKVASLQDFARKLLVKLYQERCGTTAITLADLEITVGANKEYDRGNKWNNDFCVHLQHPANTLRAQIDIAARGAIVRSDSSGTLITDVKTLIGCDPFGDPARQSDPTIGDNVNKLARENRFITLENPVGLYMTELDTSGWTTPDKTDAQTFWKVLKGKTNKDTGKNMIVRAEFAVPASKSYTVSDIKIGGVPIDFGSQIAEHVKMRLGARFGPKDKDLKGGKLTAPTPSTTCP